MNMTSLSQIKHLLDDIQGCFRELHAMTRRLVSDFSIPALEEAIRGRSLLVQKITAQNAVLQRCVDTQLLTGYEQYREIGDHLSALQALDGEVTTAITRQMHEIRQELLTLSVAAPALRAYTRHCRR